MATWLLALGAAVTLGVLGLGIAVLIDARNDAWQQSRRATDNLIVTLSRDIARNVDLLDASLDGVMRALKHPEFAQASPEIRRMAMFGRTASAEYLGALLLTDNDGQVIAYSASREPPALNLADREYFQIHKDRIDAGLFISRPFFSKVRNGDPSIALTRRFSGPDGEFEGVVMGIMRLAFFEDMFARLDLGRTGIVTLFRDDGHMLMRRPLRFGDIDADLGGNQNFLHMREARDGSFFGTAIGGAVRFWTFSRIGDLPLILAVSVDVEEVYEAWTRKAIGIGVALTVLCCSTMGLCLLFRREVRHRKAAESSLRQAAQRLEVMATTDALTGLRNRRALEDALQREWQRASRNQTQIAILMIDADYFKLFNDRYGHPAGDGVLRHLARAIEAGGLRATDISARYGGEEFIVVLPETDCADACVVAERIRATVEGFAIPHAGNPHGKATVSIGVAAAYAHLSEPPACLIHLADLALYRAKEDGRNKIAAAPAIRFDRAGTIHPLLSSGAVSEVPSPG